MDRSRILSFKGEHDILRKHHRRKQHRFRKASPVKPKLGRGASQKIAEDIFFDGACVHNWTEEQTEASRLFSSDKWIFTTDQAVSRTSTDGIFKKLDLLQTAKDRLDYLQSNPKELQGKYRFANPNHGANIHTKVKAQRASFFSSLLGKKH